MDRRDFLVASSAAAATATVIGTAVPSAQVEPALAAPALASGARELRLAMAWPDTVAGFGDSALRLARRIERMSGGCFRIVAASGSVGSAAVTAEDADLTHSMEHDRVPSHPAFSYFAGLPGFSALNALDLDAWLAVGGGQDLWDDLAAGFGTKPLLAGHTGRWPGLWSTKDVRSLADLSGEGILALGLTRDVAAGLGAKPLDLPIGAWAGSLASGAATAAEWGGAEANMVLGLAGPARYVIGFGLAPAGSALALGVRRSLWESLAPADQSLFAACAAEEFRLTLAESRAHEAMLRRSLAEVRGIRAKPFPEDVLGALSGVADAVVAHAAGGDRTAARINASYMAFRQAVTGLEPLRGAFVS